MPKDSLAVTLQVWEAILAAMETHEKLQTPIFRQKRDELAAMLQRVRELAAEQLSLQARRQAVTQDLRIVKSLGRDLEISLRTLIKGELGHRDVELVAFTIRPIRRRSRASAWETAPDAMSLSIASCLPGMPSSANRAPTSAIRPAPLVMTMKLTISSTPKITSPSATEPPMMNMAKPSMTWPAALVPV